MKTTQTSLKAALAALVAEHGMAAVLATTRNLMQDEVAELLEMDNDIDTETAEKLDVISLDVLMAADAYAKL